VERINVPTLIGVGLQDPICPPRCVFTMIKYLKNTSPEVEIYPKQGHGLNPVRWKRKIRWIKKIGN